MAVENVQGGGDVFRIRSAVVVGGELFFQAFQFRTQTGDHFLLLFVKIDPRCGMSFHRLAVDLEIDG